MHKHYEQCDSVIPTPQPPTHRAARSRTDFRPGLEPSLKPPLHPQRRPMHRAPNTSPHLIPGRISRTPIHLPSQQRSPQSVLLRRNIISGDISFAGMRYGLITRRHNSVSSLPTSGEEYVFITTQVAEDATKHTIRHLTAKVDSLFKKHASHQNQLPRCNVLFL